MQSDIKEILDFHADDYGVSKNSCDGILDLLSKGFLDSISFLPNMTAFECAAKALKDFDQANPQKKPLVSVHLNFFEGHCVASASDVPDLVDERGYFKISWGSLFKWNYNPIKRQKIKRQLTKEILGQTKKCVQAQVVDPLALRFDSHQHSHMIPMVFEALCDAIMELEREGLKTSFIRNTQDPILPYFKIKDLRPTFSKINIVKCLILNHYSFFVQRRLKKMGLGAPYLCGVFFSGHMDSERIQKVIGRYAKKPLKEGRFIELLFHPGSVLQSEITEEFVKPDFNRFHLSDDRRIERESVATLRIS